jgi:hypothetical protein
VVKNESGITENEQETFNMKRKNKQIKLRIIKKINGKIQDTRKSEQ